MSFEEILGKSLLELSEDHKTTQPCVNAEVEVIYELQNST